MSKILKSCNLCGKQTKNPKYCSKSCAQIVNNTFPRKRMVPNKEYFCKSCNSYIGKGWKFQRRLCKNCFANTIKYDWDNITLLEFKNKLKNTYQVHARIRDKARKIYNKLKLFYCRNCKYDKFIEVCHIKPVSSYDENTQIKEINSIDNLIGLCPNCHWEFDHDLLKIADIKSE